jgi:hypothetical protein
MSDKNKFADRQFRLHNWATLAVNLPARYLLSIVGLLEFAPSLNSLAIFK